MLIQLRAEEIKEAFDGDFEEVPFDHKPTHEDIMLIKLQLVANRAHDNAIRQVVEYIEKNSHPIYNDGELGKKPPCGICLENVYWQELKKEVEK